MGNTSLLSRASSRASRRDVPKTPLQAAATMGLAMGYDSLDHRQEETEEEEVATGGAAEEGMEEEEEEVKDARNTRCLGRRDAIHALSLLAADRRHRLLMVHELPNDLLPLLFR